jgi:predicted ATPase
LIKTIRLQGFKAAFDSKDIALSALTAFIGRNGAGKSSVIEALQWLQESLASGLDAATTERFQSFDDLCNKRTDEIDLTLDFMAPSGKPVRYELAVERGESGRSVVGRERCTEGRTSGAVATIRSIRSRTLAGHGPTRLVNGPRIALRIRDDDTLALAQTTRSGAKGAERLLEFIRRAVFLRLSPTAIAEPGPLRVPSRGAGIDEEGRATPAVIRLLSKSQAGEVRERLNASLRDVEGIGVVPMGENRGVLSITERMKARGGTRSFDIPAWMLSEGTRRIAAIYTLLAREPLPSLLAIEEVENGLDPWTLQQVVDALRDAAGRGVQVVLTTHSPYLLDRLELDDVVHVERAKGETVYRRLREYEVVRENEGRVPPGIMYVSNFLGDIEE